MGGVQWDEGSRVHQEHVVVGDLVAQGPAAAKRDDGHQRQAPGQPEGPLVSAHIVLHHTARHVPQPIARNIPHPFVCACT